MRAPPVHFSRLKLMALSPAHYAAADEREEETSSMRMGTLVHSLVLGGELIVYDGERTGNAWKAFRALVAGEPFLIYDGPHRGKEWEAAKERAEGRIIVTSADVEASEKGRRVQVQREAARLRPATIVTVAEYDRANACADIVRAHPVAAPLLEGQREAPLSWSLLGRRCAGTLDVLHPARVVEVKTSASAEPDWFGWQARRMFYPAQCWWYREGARENGYAIDDAYIIAIETRPPFAVTCMQLTERALEQGAKSVRLWLERLLACESAGVWPEYVQSVVELDVPDDEGFALTGFDEDEAA